MMGLQRERRATCALYTDSFTNVEKGRKMNAMTLDAIRNRVFTIRQQAETDVDLPFRKEMREYKNSHIKPYIPFFSFGDRRKKAQEAVKEYEDRIQRITTKYQNHALIIEWTELQQKCPHIWGEWEEIDGPSEMRTCSVCYEKQHRWNFPE